MRNQKCIHITPTIPTAMEDILPKLHASGSSKKTAGPTHEGIGLPFDLQNRIQHDADLELWEGRDDARKRHRLLVVRAINESATTRSLKKLEDFEHPSVLPFQVYLDAAQLLATTPVPDGSLRELFEKRWTAGQSGLPQVEMAEWIAGLAVDLANIYAEYNFCHLWLRPDNLIFTDGRLRFAYFGIGQFVWCGNRKRLSTLNPGYFATECHTGPFSHKSDQFSLASIYVEMRTGKHPFANYLHDGRQRRRMPHHATGGISRNRATPDLRLLSDKEREVIKRALNPDPFNRYPNSTEFSEALLAALPPTKVSFSEPTPENTLPPTVLKTPPAHHPLFPKPGSYPETGELPALPNFNEYESMDLIEPKGSGTLPEMAGQLMPEFPTTISKLTLGTSELYRADQYQFLIHPRQGLQHSFCTRLPFQDLLEALNSFNTKWNATIVHNQHSGLVLVVKSGTSLWDRLLGRQGELMVILKVVRKHSPSPVTAKVVVKIKAADDNLEHLGRDLRRVGPKLIHSLRTFCQAVPEIRADLRWSCTRPIQVLHIFSELGMPVSMACMGKDISQRGIGFYSPQNLPRPDIFVHLPWLPDFQKTAVPAQVVRTTTLRNGWYEIGASFSHR